MAVNYSTAVKNSRLQAVIDAIGNGGLLKIGTSGMGAVLATIPLSNPAFATPSGGAMSLSGAISDTAADGTGTAAEAQITTSGGTVVISGLTVGTSGANINLNSVAIQVNQTVTISSGTITHG